MSVGRTDRRSPGRAPSRPSFPGALRAGLGGALDGRSVTRGCSASPDAARGPARSRLDGVGRSQPRGPGGQRATRGPGEDTVAVAVAGASEPGEPAARQVLTQARPRAFLGSDPRPLQAPGEANGGRATWERPGSPDAARPDTSLRTPRGHEPADPARTRAERDGPAIRFLSLQAQPRGPNKMT
ncbi:translation initiation factor IF-2-like [Mustela erminea]|uniref:translation initiation factor IF-2-like n=1 Tax=Mustela erminea TaxID=36723 RepID=UPI0013867027|nr:translation initiation factor IF-2-like [Mustela erminea]